MRSRYASFGALLTLLASLPLTAGTITGRLLDHEGKPVAGAEVAWLRYRGAEEVLADESQGIAAPILGTTRADAEGRFRAAVSDAAGPVALRIVASGLPFAVVTGPLDPADASDLPAIIFPSLARIRGAVLGPDRKPVSGALVEDASEIDTPDSSILFLARSQSGPDGAFFLEDASAGPGLLRVRAAGFVSITRASTAGGPAENGTERFTLEPSGAVAGRVTDAPGRPVAGALVVCGDSAARTDASGRYRLEGVAPGARTIEAAAGDRAARRGTAVGKDGPTALDLRLSAATEISGSVLDAHTRRPIRGVRVAISDAVASAGRSGFAAFAPRAAPSSTPRPRRIALTDSRGRFRAPGLPPGTYALRAERSGYLAASLPRVAAAAGVSGSAAMALVPAASVSGRVVDEKKKAVAGATVRLTGEALGRARFARGAGAAMPVPAGGPRGISQVTGPDGSFRLESLPAISSGVALEASRSGFVAALRPGLTWKTGQALHGIELVLRVGQTARGKVVDAETKPVAGAEIRVAAADRRGGGRGFFRARPTDTKPDAVTGADGSFSVSGLQEGRYQVTATHEGFAPASEPSLPIPQKDGAVWPPIVLSRGASVAGVVVDEQSAPIAGAVVATLAQGAEPQSASTDGQGAFRIGDLPRGRALMLGVSAPGYAPSGQGATPPAETLRIVLTRSGTIRGRVVDAVTGDPVTEFTLSRTAGGAGRRRGGFGGNPAAADGGGGATEFHSDDGLFELTGVPAGSWTLHAAAATYRPAAVSGVDLEVAETKEDVVIELRHGGSLSGHVVDAAEGAPVANATVSCCDAGGGPPGGRAGAAGAAAPGSPSAVTDADGRFGLDALPDGKVTLTVTQPDYVGTAQEVDPAATADVTISLSSGAEISGVVISTDGAGGAVPGAQLRLDEEGDSGGAIGGSQSGQADGAGLFRFEHLAAGRYRLSAQSKTASSSPQEIVLAEGQPMDGVQLAVATGVEIDGTVSGLSADKLGGVNVTATATGYRGTAVTGSDGKFTLQGVAPGVVRFTASTPMPGGRAAAQNVDVGDDAAQMPVEIAFQGGSSLSGTVTRAGKPLPAVTVAAAPDPPDGTGQRYSATTDGTGRYEIQGMNDGGYQVSVLGPDVSYRTAVTVSGDTNGDLTLPGAAISGFVTDASTGDPLDGAAVSAESAQGAGLKRAQTDSNGFYAIKDVDPGDYQVSARRDGYQLKNLSASVSSDAPELDFALEKGTGLTIQVTDGLSTLPLSGVIATALDANGALAFEGSVSLDTTGTGQIPSLPPGRYRVFLFSSGYAPQPIGAVDVPSATIPVSMTPGGSVQVRAAQGFDGQIVDGSGALVPLTPFRFDGTVTVSPPVTILPHLAPGSYGLVVPSGDGSTTLPFAVTEGQTTTISLP